jgi:integrase
MGTNGQFGSIRKLPSGRYQVRYFHLGRRITADHTFPTKADARAFLAGVETDVKRGNYVDPSAGRIMFGEYAGWWIEQRPLRPRTRETYDSQLKHLLRPFGPAQLTAISPADVRTWHGRLSQSELHPNTVAKIYRLLRTILGTAVDDGVLPSNPARIRGASKERAVERPLLSWDDVVELANAIEPRFSALVWTAAASGLRFGELSGLEMRHLDVDRSELRVDQALYFAKGSGPRLGPPKTESAHRTVVVPAQIIHRLCEHIESFVDDARPKTLVFTSVKGSPLLNRTFAPYWRRALDELGMTNIRFHDLRHLAGTEAATAGASLREVMARMGHASSSASLRYLKASEIRDRDIADAIGARMPVHRVDPR